MNEESNIPPLMHTAFPPPLPEYVCGEQPLGELEADRQPITSLVTAIEAILREPRRVLFQLSQPSQGKLLRDLLLITLACSIIYGVVVGTYSFKDQLWAAPAKIATGLLISGLICLPSLYIFSCLGGAQARLAEVFGLLMGLLTLTTILLIGFAPVAWVFSQSTGSVAMMGALHLLFWFIATGFGLRFLDRGFRHVKADGGMIKLWTVIFVLVALQMTTALRPIVGTAPTLLPTEKQFFVSHWMDSLGIETGSEVRHD